MILEHRKFRRELNDWRSGKEGHLFLCSRDMDELFSIPANVTTIWVSIHDRPTASTMALKIKRPLYMCVGVDAENGWHGHEFEDEANRILKKYVGLTVYVEVEYYEPEGTSDEDPSD